MEEEKDRLTKVAEAAYELFRQGEKREAVAMMAEAWGESNRQVIFSDTLGVMLFDEEACAFWKEAAASKGLVASVNPVDYFVNALQFEPEPESDGPRFNPLYARLRYNLGWAYQRISDTDKAIDCFARIVADYMDVSIEKVVLDRGKNSNKGRFLMEIEQEAARCIKTGNESQ